MSKQISVHRTKEEFATIDDEDFDRVSQFKWYVIHNPTVSYAFRFLDDEHKSTQSLHRFIMNEPPGIEVDHRNRNGLDCQKHNLRLATSSQNKMNQGIRSDSTSRIKGVSWSPERRKWQVYIQIDKKRIPLGRFETVEEALTVRRNAEIEHYGEFAPILDYSDAIEKLKKTVLPRCELVGRGRKKGFFGVRPKSHTTGHVGVYQHKNGRWVARLGGSHLGYHATFDDAVAARTKALAEHPTAA